MQSKIHQAVILSAGFGTRLLTLTRGKIPKAMIPVGGKPLLERHIEQFKKYGVTEFFVNLFYLPDVIKNYFGDGAKWGVKIHYALEPEIRGTAGGIKNFSAESARLPASPLLQRGEPDGQGSASGGDGTLKNNFFAIYGDIYSEVDYGKMADAFAGHAGAIGMELVGNTDHPEDSDLVEVDNDLRFLKIHPKPHEALPKNYKSMRGIFILNEKILKYIPEKTYYEIDHDLLPDALAKEEKFYGYECGDYLKDVGTPERYVEVENISKKKRRQATDRPPLRNNTTFQHSQECWNVVVESLPAVALQFS